MKRIAVLLAALLCLTACAAAPMEGTPETTAAAPDTTEAITTVEEPTEPGTDAVTETVVQVQWAEDVLQDFSDYDTFAVEGAEPPVQIVFSSETGARDFKVLALTLADVDAAGEMTFSTEELYTLDVLTPERPLVVETAFYGSIPNNGISYVDERGNTRCFAVEMSGADGSLILWEYKEAE